MKARDLLPARWTSGQTPARVIADSPLHSLHREMNRLFDDFLHDFDLTPGMARAVAGVEPPRVDVSETDTEVQVTAELPGIDEKEVEVSLSQGVLTIKGEKKFEKEQKDKNYHRVERSYGSFQRSIPLPCDVDEDKADAAFKQGVLTVKLPKTKAAQQSKKIAVKSGG